MQYDPTGQYPVRTYDVIYRQDATGSWPARVYQPEGAGPFPALLDVHGGAWSRGSYTDNERLDRVLAASGLVVVAPACRQAPRFTYPAQVEDINYATRWLKAHAGDFQAEARVLGALGTSSGGQTLMLSAMRPLDRRYTTFALPEAPGLDASLQYVVAAWPILDPYARYLFALEQRRTALVDASEAYFLTSETMQEGNPQCILERGETVALPPTLIVQGTADESVPLSVCQRFSEAYRQAGGAVELVLFPNMPHGFARDPGEESDRALALMRTFIAQQLQAAALAV